MISLMARMGLDTSGFTGGLKAAQAKMENARASLSSGAANLISSQLAGVVGVGALVAGAKSVVDYGGKVTDLADKYGITTGMVQQLSYAAGQTGVDVETALNSIKKVAIATADALGGNEEKMAAFERLGITAEQLRTLSPDQIFLAVGNSLKDMPLTAQTFSDINSTLGKTGQDLLPMFREGLQGMMADAVALGLVMDKEIIGKLDAAGDGMAAAGMKMKAAFAPAVTFLADSFNSLFDVLDSFQEHIAETGGKLIAFFDLARQGKLTEAAALLKQVKGEIVSGDEFFGRIAAKENARADALAARESKRESDRASTLKVGAGADEEKAGGKSVGKEAEDLAKLQKQIKDKRFARLPEDQRLAQLQRDLAEAKRDSADTLGDGSAENLRAQLRVEELTDLIARGQTKGGDKVDAAKLDSIQQIGGRIGENAAITNGQKQIKTLEEILKAVADGNANTAVLKP